MKWGRPRKFKRMENNSLWKEKKEVKKKVKKVKMK